MAERDTRRSQRRGRDQWDGGEFEDFSSHSSGQPPQDPFAEFARNHAANRPRPSRSASSAESRGRSAPRERPRERPERPRPSREARPSRSGPARGSARSRPAREPARSSPERARPPERRGREPVPRKRRKPMGLFQRRLLMVLVFVVMLGGTVFLAESLLLRVTQVRVTGDAVYAEEDILAICDYHTGDNLLLIPRADREEALERQLPYIAEADISIRVPGTVVVHITAAQPVCSISAGGGWYVVDREGKVLEARADPAEGLLRVTGLTPHSAQLGQPLGLEGEEQAAAFQEIIETIGEIGAAGEFTRLDLSDLYNIRMWYQDRVECLLGSATDLEHKLVYGRGLFDTSREESIQADQTGTLDLSYLNENNRAFFNPGQVSPDAPSATPNPQPDIQTGQEGGEQGENTPEGGGGETGTSSGGRGADIPDEIYTGG